MNCYVQSLDKCYYFKLDDDPNKYTISSKYPTIYFTWEYDCVSGNVRAYDLYAYNTGELLKIMLKAISILLSVNTCEVTFIRENS